MPLSYKIHRLSEKSDFQVAFLAHIELWPLITDLNLVSKLGLLTLQQQQRQPQPYKSLPRKLANR